MLDKSFVSPNYCVKHIEASCVYDFSLEHPSSGTLTVNIETEEQYGIADKEKTFTSENALGEAVEWTADILIDLYQTIEQRTKPYQKGHEDYLRAVKGT